MEHEKSIKDFESQISVFLTEKKCPTMLGLFYLKNCVARVCMDFECIVNMGKLIYDKVASEHSTSKVNLERCLRNFSENWWNQSKCSGLFEEKPCNKELISVLARLVLDGKAKPARKPKPRWEDEDCYISIYEHALL